MTPRPKVLFFDVGFTLVDETAVWQRRCAEQAATEEARRLGLRAEGIYHEIENASRARLPQFKTVVQKYGLRCMAPYRHELETLYPQAPRVLAALAGQYRLGVIANQTDGLRERLDRFGILEHFAYVVSSWDAGVQKPDSALFVHALRLAGCAPDEAVMIGDRLDNDIAPAKALGLQTVWIRQGFGALQTPLSPADTPDHAVDGLCGLLPLFL